MLFLPQHFIAHYKKPIYSSSLCSVDRVELPRGEKKLKDIPKGKKAQFEEKEKASEPDMAGILGHQTGDLKQLLSI